MLTPQAEALAAEGFHVIWYDRRGTGVEQNVDDAAQILREVGPAAVIGFSSGGVIALALAVRHPVDRVVAWEPPALGMLPDGLATHAALLAPIEAHLAEHPGDWAGAFRVMTTDPAMLANAELAIRSDARLITKHRFDPGELPADRTVIAVSRSVNPILAAVAERLGDPVVVDDADDHEVYLKRPEVLAAWYKKSQS